MELSLESAFSTGGFVGHVAYLLLVISMLMRNITMLRIFVIASAIVAIAYDAIWLRDPVGVFWETLLVLVNVVQILITWMGNRRASFSEEELSLITARLADLPRRDARRLLNMGLWVDGAPGTELTREGEPVDHLIFLINGRVRIECRGRTVGVCGPGNFVGEMSLVGDTPASATAVVAEPSRYWMMATERVRALRTSAPAMAAALELGIAHDMKMKLLTVNAAANRSGASG